MINDISKKIDELISAEEYNGLNDLVKLGTKATPRLVTILSKDTDALMRKRAAIALGKIRDKTVIKSLVDQLIDKDPTVVISIIDALASMGQKKYSEKIVPFLNNSDASVRRHAAKALGNLKAKDTKKDLEKLLEKEEYEFVRKEGISALKKIDL